MSELGPIDEKKSGLSLRNLPPPIESNEPAGYEAEFPFDGMDVRGSNVGIRVCSYCIERIEVRGVRERGVTVIARAALYLIQKLTNFV